MLNNNFIKMTDSLEVQYVLSILTSIITGGFVLVYVEIGNRINRENDRCETLITPFMRKISAYCRFISYYEPLIISKECDDNEKEKQKHLKSILERIAKKGKNLINSGVNYTVDSFTYNELRMLAEDINNLWFWYEKINPCYMNIDNNGYEVVYKSINEELKEINPMFLSRSCDLGLVAELSGGLYIEFERFVEGEIYKHEKEIELYKCQIRGVLVAIILVLILLGMLLLGILPVWLLKILTMVILLFMVAALLMLGIDKKTQIKWYAKLKNLIQIMRTNHHP